MNPASWVRAYLRERDMPYSRVTARGNRVRVKGWKKSKDSFMLKYDAWKLGIRVEVK